MKYRTCEFVRKNAVTGESQVCYGIEVKRRPWFLLWLCEIWVPVMYEAGYPGEWAQLTFNDLESANEAIFEMKKQDGWSGWKTENQKVS